MELLSNIAIGLFLALQMAVLIAFLQRIGRCQTMIIRVISFVVLSNNSYRLAKRWNRFVSYPTILTVLENPYTVVVISIYGGTVPMLYADSYHYFAMAVGSLVLLSIGVYHWSKLMLSRAVWRNMILNMGIDSPMSVY